MLLCDILWSYLMLRAVTEIWMLLFSRQFQCVLAKHCHR